MSTSYTSHLPLLGSIEAAMQAEHEGLVVTSEQQASVDILRSLLLWKLPFFGLCNYGCVFGALGLALLQLSWVFPIYMVVIFGAGVRVQMHITSQLEAAIHAVAFRRDAMNDFAADKKVLWNRFGFAVPYWVYLMFSLPYLAVLEWGDSSLDGWTAGNSWASWTPEYAQSFKARWAHTLPPQLAPRLAP